VFGALVAVAAATLLRGRRHSWTARGSHAR
jgi:hypothetical protein